MHLCVFVGLRDDYAAVVEAEVDNGEQRCTCGEDVETVPKDLFSAVVNLVDDGLEEYGKEHIGNEYGAAVKEEARE